MKGPIKVNENKTFHEMDPEERAMALKMYRVVHDLTQKEFAEKAGCSLTTIVYIENPKNKTYGKGKKKIRLDIIWKIEDILEKEARKNDCEA